MKPTKEQSIAQIERAIIYSRDEVIDALKKSFVVVPDSIDDNTLLDLVMTSLRGGNGFLVYHLSKVIVKDELNGEESSNIFGWGKSKESETTSNVPVPEGYDDDSKKTSGSSGAGVGLATSVMDNLMVWINTNAQKNIAKTQADAAANADATNIELARIQKEMQEKLLASQGGGGSTEKDNSGIIIASIIGGVVLVGTIVTVVLLKKK